MSLEMEQPFNVPIECLNKDGEKLFWFANVLDAKTTLMMKHDTCIIRVLKKQRHTTANLVFKLTNEPEPVLTEDERSRRLARVFSVMRGGPTAKFDAMDQDEIESDNEENNDSSDEAFAAAIIPSLRSESHYADKAIAVEEKVHAMFREAPRHIRNRGPDPTHLSHTPLLYTTIKPGDALYDYILNHLIEEASLLNLQAGAVVRARILYTHPVSKRQEWRCDPICIVSQSPFLATNNSHQKQVIVYDGRDLYAVSTDDIILHNEDQILHLLNSQHSDHRDILHGLRTASLHWIQSQWTLIDVQEFCAAIRKVRNSHGYPNLAKLYKKSSFSQYMLNNKHAKKRSYQDIIDFYYQYRALQKPSSNKYYRLLSVFECSTFIRSSKLHQTTDRNEIEHILMQQNLLGAKVQLDDRLSPWDKDDGMEGDTSTVGSMPDADVNNYREEEENSDSDGDGKLRSKRGGGAYLSHMSSSRPRPSHIHSHLARGRRATPINNDDNSDDNSSNGIKVKIEGGLERSRLGNINSSSRWTSSSSAMNNKRPLSAAINSKMPVSRTIVQPSSAAFTRRVVAQIEQNGRVRRLFRSLKAVTRFFDVKGVCTLRTALLNHSMYNGYYWQDYDGPAVDFLSNESDYIDTNRIENFQWQPALPWLMSANNNNYAGDENDGDDDNNNDNHMMQMQQAANVGITRPSTTMQRVDSIANRARIPNIKESRVFYKHHVASPYEVLLWIPRTPEMTSRYHEILDKLVRADLESTLQTREKERKWSYPYQLLELISRSKFNALDPDLMSNIYTKIHQELGSQWKSMHKKRLLQTLEQLYSQDYIYDSYIPASKEYPEGFNTPVLTEQGMTYFKQLHAQQMSLLEKLELQRVKKQQAQSLAQELLQESSTTNTSLTTTAGTDEVRRFMQNYCIEDMLIALYQLAKFEKTPHVRVVCAFFTRYANCPEQWKMLTVHQQMEILRHAYEINTHMSRMILNNGIYSLRLNTTIVPSLQVLEEQGDVILDADREHVFFLLRGMVEYVENKFMPVSITDVYSSNSHAASSFTAIATGGARGGNRQGTRGHSFVTNSNGGGGRVPTAPEWNYQNNQQQQMAAGRGSTSRNVPNRPGLSHRFGNGPAIRRKGKRQRVEYSDEDDELSEDEDLVIDRRHVGEDADEDSEIKSLTKSQAARRQMVDDDDENKQDEDDLMSVADDDDDDEDDDDEDDDDIVGDEGSEDMDLVHDKPQLSSSSQRKKNQQQPHYEVNTAGRGSVYHAHIGQGMDLDYGDEEDDDLQSLNSA